jgi:hypothetical protein
MSGFPRGGSGVATAIGNPPVTVTGTPTAGEVLTATGAAAADWEAVPGADVLSVFGRTGAVVATSGDYAVGQVTGAAPLASPALTGTPTAPSAATGTSTTQIATTAFVAGNFLNLLGTVPMAGALAMGAHKVTGLANGSAASDAAAFGQIPVPANGYGITGNTGATPTPAVALSEISGQTAGPVAMTANTLTSIFSTASLPVGKHLVAMGAVIEALTATGTSAEAKVVLGTATATFEGRIATACSTPGLNGNQFPLDLVFVVNVTVAGTLTFQAQCQQTAQAIGTTEAFSFTGAIGYSAEQFA